MNHVRSFHVTVLIAASVVLVACGSTSDVSVTSARGGVPAPPTTVKAVPAPPNDPGLQDPAVGVPGYEPSALTLVGSESDFNKYGWVDSRSIGLEPGHDDWALIPVFDKVGTQIAWWGTGVGWLDFKVVEAPGFSYRQLYEARKKALPSRLPDTSN